MGESLGAASGGVSLAGDLIGNALMVAAPALAGPFVQLNYAIKLIDKLRFINVRFGSMLTAFMGKIGGGSSSSPVVQKNELTVSEGKLTRMNAYYSQNTVTTVKMVLFMLLYSLRWPKRRFVEDIRKSRAIVKWRVYLAHAHSTVEFMLFNSSLCDATFPGSTMLIYYFKSVRKMSIFQLLLTQLYLTLAMLYVLELIYISIRWKYSSKLNQLSLVVQKKSNKISPDLGDGKKQPKTDIQLDNSEVDEALPNDEAGVASVKRQKVLQ